MVERLSELPRKVLILLAQGFEAFEAAVFTDVFGWADTVCRLPVRAVTAGLRSSVDCAWNLRVVPEMLIPDVQPEQYSALVVPGGFGGGGYFEDAFAPEFLEVIEKFNYFGKPVVGVCVGALALGRAGILKGRRAVTYHREGGMWRSQLASMGACVVDEPVVCDGNVITCTSPAAAAESAFMLLETLVGREGRLLVEVQMGFRSAVTD
ncbi:MAG: DJ-1/PfpI family protein [Desulfatiglandaceae bacterium]